MIMIPFNLINNLKLIGRPKLPKEKDIEPIFRLIYYNMLIYQSNNLTIIVSKSGQPYCILQIIIKSNIMAIIKKYIPIK